MEGDCGAQRLPALGTACCYAGPVEGYGLAVLNVFSCPAANDATSPCSYNTCILPSHHQASSYQSPDFASNLEGGCRGSTGGHSLFLPHLQGALCYAGESRAGGGSSRAMKGMRVRLGGA